MAAEGAPAAAAPAPDKVHTWPYLVRVEFIAGAVVLLLLLVWSLAIDAPLEGPADPARTPDPSKAPWYFVGLQELLVYFDPWFAGVVAPTLIITGLMVIPFVDRNPKGNGYYTLRERPLAVSIFLFGFLGLWLGMIGIGVFLRGPGWGLYAPWRPWDAQPAAAAASVDLPWLLGRAMPAALQPALLSRAGQTVTGGLLVIGFLLLPVALWSWARRRKQRWAEELGALRYAVVALHLTPMAGIVAKMLLHWTLGVKYVWVTPFFNL
ncbi:MAG TPA: hypothetical protein VF832_00160 [Longimicrobiales bacterium]